MKPAASRGLKEPPAKARIVRTRLFLRPPGYFAARTVRGACPARKERLHAARGNASLCAFHPKQRTVRRRSPAARETASTLRGSIPISVPDDTTGSVVPERHEKKRTPTEPVSSAGVRLACGPCCPVRRAGRRDPLPARRELRAAAAPVAHNLRIRPTGAVPAGRIRRPAVVRPLRAAHSPHPGRAGRHRPCPGGRARDLLLCRHAEYLCLCGPVSGRRRCTAGPLSTGSAGVL